MASTSRIRAAGVALLLLAVPLAACDDGTAPPSPASISISPAATFIVGAGETASLSATVRDGRGAIMDGETVRWSSADDGVATVDVSGTVTGVASGIATIRAEAGDARGTAKVEVYVADEVESYTVGETYTGRNDYIEYLPGDLPIILSAGHGGDLEPDEIPDRSYGTTVTDANTMELTHAVADAVEARLGGRPHVVISRVDRVKLDPNRELEEAAQDNPFAELAWHEFHAYLEEASDLVAADFGTGLYLDMHGHGHEILRLELGYLLSAADLRLSDAELDDGGHAATSSTAALADAVDIPFSSLLRGPMSFGTLLADRGVRAVPGSAEPDPGTDPYFSGGYSTRRHGSRDGGTVSAIQIEHHRIGLRDTAENRAAYAAVLAEVLELYLAEHYGIELGALAPAGQGNDWRR